MCQQTIGTLITETIYDSMSSNPKAYRIYEQREFISKDGYSKTLKFTEVNMIGCKGERLQVEGLEFAVKVIAKRDLQKLNL